LFSCVFGLLLLPRPRQAIGDVLARGPFGYSSVQTTATAPVKTTTVGGPAPYWQTYTYDLLGDRTGMVAHDTTGNALNDTTEATTYNGADGTTAVTRPDRPRRHHRHPLQQRQRQRQRHLTPDPLFQAGDPNQMGGYAYAADNPVNGSDPTGYDDWYREDGPPPGPPGAGPPSSTPDTDTSTGTTSSQGKKKSSGCHHFWGCVAHVLKKAAPYAGVAARGHGGHGDCRNLRSGVDGSPRTRMCQRCDNDSRNRLRSAIGGLR
jgi:hypothetical protein